MSTIIDLLIDALLYLEKPIRQSDVHGLVLRREFKNSPHNPRLMASGIQLARSLPEVRKIIDFIPLKKIR